MENPFARPLSAFDPWTGRTSGDDRFTAFFARLADDVEATVAVFGEGT